MGYDKEKLHYHISLDRYAMLPRFVYLKNMHTRNISNRYRISILQELSFYSCHLKNKEKDLGKSWNLGVLIGKDLPTGLILLY